MGKKLALNVLYNIGIIACIIAVYTFGFEYPHWDYMACAIIIGGVLITLKIRLLKEVRNMQKP